MALTIRPTIDPLQPPQNKPPERIGTGGRVRFGVAVSGTLMCLVPCCLGGWESDGWTLIVGVVASCAGSVIRTVGGETEIEGGSGEDTDTHGASEKVAAVPDITPLPWLSDTDILGIPAGRK